MKRRDSTELSSNLHLSTVAPPPLHLIHTDMHTSAAAATSTNATSTANDDNLGKLYSAGEETHWLHACLACMEPEVLSSALHEPGGGDACL